MEVVQAPFKYTHQYAEWIGMHDEGGKYPDFLVKEKINDKEFIRDETYLIERMQPLLELRNTYNVPVFVSEFGLIHHCFEQGRGGLQYVQDVVAFLEQEMIGFTYWDFQSTVMGAFQSDARSPLTRDVEQPGLIKRLFFDGFPSGR